jgi:uncharacterized protein (TIGR02147 family)
MEIYSFDDYRDYLKARIKKEPNGGWGMSSSLARRIRISPAQMSQVLTGRKNLTPDQSYLASKALGLNEAGTEYFLTLVERERAGSKDLKDYYTERAQKIRVKAQKIKNFVPTHRVLTEEQKSRFYSDWRYSAIRLYCSIENGKTFEQIRLFTGVESEILREMLGFLLSAGLCDEVSGLYRMKTQRTFIEKGSTHFLQHHANWRMLGLERAKHFSRASEESVFFTSPVSISHADYLIFKTKVHEMIKEFSGRVQESPAEAVVCLNIDFFVLK